VLAQSEHVLVSCRLQEQFFFFAAARAGRQVCSSKLETDDDASDAREAESFAIGLWSRFASTRR